MPTWSRAFQEAASSALRDPNNWVGLGTEVAGSLQQNAQAEERAKLHRHMPGGLRWSSQRPIAGASSQFSALSTSVMSGPSVPDQMRSFSDFGAGPSPWGSNPTRQFTSSAAELPPASASSLLAEATSLLPNFGGGPGPGGMGAMIPPTPHMQAMLPEQAFAGLPDNGNMSRHLDAFQQRMATNRSVRATEAAFQSFGQQMAAGSMLGAADHNNWIASQARPSSSARLGTSEFQQAPASLPLDLSRRTVRAGEGAGRGSGVGPTKAGPSAPHDPPPPYSAQDPLGRQRPASQPPPSTGSGGQSAGFTHRAADPVRMPGMGKKG